MTVLCIKERFYGLGREIFDSDVGKQWIYSMEAKGWVTFKVEVKRESENPQTATPFSSLLKTTIDLSHDSSPGYGNYGTKTNNSGFSLFNAYLAPCMKSGVANFDLTHW